MARFSRSKLANCVPTIEQPDRVIRLIILPNNRQTESAHSIPPAHARVKASRNSQSSVQQGFLDTQKAAGTALAIKGKDISRTMLGRSAVVRRGRRSRALSKKDVENIRAAGVYTAEEHRELNRFTTIHFEAASITDPVWAIGRMMKLAGDWLRTKGAVPTYIWVREAGEGKGDHVHLLWHVPPALMKEFAKRERGWRKLIGAKPRKGAFKTKPVGFSYSHGAYQIQHGRHFAEASRGVFDYILKGVVSNAAASLGIAHPKPGGELWGKRYGMSENINRTARQRLK